jgi:hypothetical protein
MKRQAEDRFDVDALIGAICKRPQMYVMGELFPGVMNYLSGFHSALAWSGAAKEEVAVLDGFFNWHYEKLDRDKSLVTWDEFRQRHPDDHTALKQLAAYWSEYRGAGWEG